MMVGLIRMAPSVQRTATKPWAQQLQGLGFNSQQWQIPIFSIASRLALQPTLSSIQWVVMTVSPRLKQLGNETDH